jgi:hypothetical protein
MASVKGVVTASTAVIFAGFSAILGVFLFIGGAATLFAEDETPENIETREISGTLVERPHCSAYANGDMRSVYFSLVEYPGVSFDITGDALQATGYIAMNDRLDRGDSLYVLVSPEDGDIATRSSVAVLGLRSSELTYLTVDGYCKKVNKNAPFFGIALMVFGGLFITVAVVAVRRGIGGGSDSASAE